MSQAPNEAAMKKHAEKLCSCLEKAIKVDGLGEPARNAAAATTIALSDGIGRGVPQEHIRKRVDVVMEALSDLSAIRKLNERDENPGALERVLAVFNSRSSEGVLRLRVKMEAALEGYCSARGSGQWRRSSSSGSIPKAVAGG